MCIQETSHNIVTLYRYSDGDVTSETGQDRTTYQVNEAMEVVFVGIYMTKYGGVYS